MTINLANFQLNAIKSLLESMDEACREIVLKSPTGSGKTIILTHFMDEYIKGHAKTVFVWLTPGKGDLEEQSKAKMDRYIHNAQTKLLADVMTSGFSENDCCFINWEKLNTKGNNALKESERTNFSEWIDKALNDGISFKIIIDESHQNFTEKSDAIIQLFKTDKIIRCSATPLVSKTAKLIEVDEKDVIAEGLIKKIIFINENFPQLIETDNHTHYLLERAYAKQQELRSLFLQRQLDINPLIIVQLPNNSDLLCDTVEKWFESKGVTVEAETLAIWLSGRHENIENISNNNAKSVAVIMKQAVATGWDCPRAQILVKLRENMDETFETQTIGRIRRMPEAKHYENELLDGCYLYTFDEKFTAGVKMSLGKSALDACTLFLKNDHKGITLTSEQRTMVSNSQNPKKALNAIAKYAENIYGIGRNKAENQTHLQIAGYIFSDDIVRHTSSGQTATLDIDTSDLNAIAVTVKLNTTIHGRAYHKNVSKIGAEISMNYEYMNSIIRKLFEAKSPYDHKILALETRQVYSFVLNNADRLRHLVREAMAAEIAQTEADIPNVSTYEFHIPHSILFTYDGKAKTQRIMEQNVYQGYLDSAEPRSTPERKFERFCERCPSVDWIYKNGDKGNEYLSIVYQDNSGKQKLFYPDYIISVRGELWIIETKGGFDRDGNSEDIDRFTPKKFEVLKRYLDKHGLKGGIVRNDARSDELCICTETYSDDLADKSWALLENVIG